MNSHIPKYPYVTLVYPSKSPIQQLRKEAHYQLCLGKNHKRWLAITGHKNIVIGLFTEVMGFRSIFTGNVMDNEVVYYFEIEKIKLDANIYNLTNYAQFLESSITHILILCDDIYKDMNLRVEDPHLRELDKIRGFFVLDNKFNVSDYPVLIKEREEYFEKNLNIDNNLWKL